MFDLLMGGGTAAGVGAFVATGRAIVSAHRADKAFIAAGESLAAQRRDRVEAGLAPFPEFDDDEFEVAS